MWLSWNDYLAWLKTQKALLPEKPVAGTKLVVDDTNSARLCPECGRILIRYRIHADLDFHLDRCGGCHGVWFDRNEWYVLHRHNLHDKINTFFTAPWQQKIRLAETKKRLEAIYAGRFGRETYLEIKRIRAWLDQQEQRESLLAYLMDKAPYSV